MKKFMLALLMLALPATAIAQNSSVRIIGRDPTGTDRPVLTTTDGRLLTSGTATARPTGTSADQVQGNNANGTADTGNPVQVAGSDGTNTRTLRTLNNGQLSVTLADSSGFPVSNGNTGIDGIASGVTALNVLGRGYVFNGTSWDRMESANAGSGTTGTGLLGVGNLGFDGAAWRSVSVDGSGRANVVVPSSGVASGTTDSGGPVKIGGFASTAASPPTAVTAGQRVNAWYTPNGAAMVSLYSDGDGTAIRSGATAGDAFPASGSSNSLRTIGFPFVYNGTTFDRLRDATSATGTTGTGLLGVGNLGWTGSTYVRFAVDPAGSQVVRDLDGQAVTVTPVTSAGTILSTQTNGFAGVSFQTSTPANGATWNFEGSNDSTDGANGNWFSVSSYQLNSAAPVTATQTPTLGVFIPATSTWVRVRVSGTLTGSVGGTASLRSLAPLPTATTINNNKAQWNTEAANAAPAASATTNYTTRDTGQAGGDYRFVNFRCFANPTQVSSSGSLLVAQGSTDNTTWVQTQSVSAATANTPVTTSNPIFFRYNRCVFVNGTTAQTGLFVLSQYGE